MPVDFLADEQARRYGRFNGDSTPSPLPRHFYLDASDKVEEFWALTRASAAEGAFVYSLANLADT
jgi:hypothetical protein